MLMGEFGGEISPSQTAAVRTDPPARRTLYFSTAVAKRLERPGASRSNRNVRRVEWWSRRLAANRHSVWLGRPPAVWEL